MEVESPPEEAKSASSAPSELAEVLDSRSKDTWAARPAPRRSRVSNRDGVDFEAVKIFIILAGLTAAMAFALRSLV